MKEINHKDIIDLFQNGKLHGVDSVSVFDYRGRAQIKIKLLEYGEERVHTIDTTLCKMFECGDYLKITCLPYKDGRSGPALLIIALV